MSARTDLCGWRSAMVVPTATSLTQAEIFDDSATCRYWDSVR
jgi:hypothetical protein